MRSGLVQGLCILAIAIGAGLFAFGRHLDPPFDAQNPAASSMHSDQDAHVAASMACGLGIGLITGGVLGLAIPWVNVVCARCCEAKASPGNPSPTP